MRTSRARARTVVAVLATTVATVLGAGGAAAATPQAQSGPQRLTAHFRTVDGVDEPIRVSAAGPVTGVGTATQTEQETPDGEIVLVTFAFPDGTLDARFVETYTMSFDPEACLGKGSGYGTYQVLGGTGAYAGASGGGTWQDHGTLVGTRIAGACQGPDSGVQPSLAVFTLTATGTTVLGGGQ